MSDNNLPNSSASVSPKSDVRRAIGDACLYGALVLNLWTVAADLGAGRLRAGALQSGFLVALSVLAWVGPRLRALLVEHLRLVEAQRDTATHQARMSAIALDAMEAQRRSGQLRVQVDAMTVN